MPVYNRQTNRSRCLACGREFRTGKRLSQHLGKAIECQQLYQAKANEESVPRQIAEGNVSDNTFELGEYVPPEPQSPSPPPNIPSPHPNIEPNQTRRRIAVQEVEDEDSAIEYVQYPGCVAESLGRGISIFEEIRRQQEALQEVPTAPFKDLDEWELAEYLIEQKHSSISKYLKMRMTKKKIEPTFRTKEAFFKKIDSLPTGPEWKVTTVTIRGDRIGSNNEGLNQVVELWGRNPVDCVKELMGNPAFRELISYAPVRAYKNGERHYSDMWTGDWWWDMQKRLPPGAVVVPIILASDKTNLSAFKGDQTAWPVYLTIGNIPKSVRRKPSYHASALIGYIPVTKLEGYKDSTRSNILHQLFHRCMQILLDPLVRAGTEGVLVTCADGMIQRVFPILAAYVADHPEQCLIVCCKENYCPRCLVKPDDRGEPTRSEARCPTMAKEVLEAHRLGQNRSEFEEQGLRPIHAPFWANLPHADVFACISPDILHQLHKGVFKDHIVHWCMSLISKEEIDSRFKAMTYHPNLRHFRNGISRISQWTGKEHKEMEKVFLGIISGAIDDSVVLAVRAFLEFTYHAQYQAHTELTIAKMENALARFHTHKDCFIKLGLRNDFNFPKMHSMLHYSESIRSLGCLDGFNTESSERLHIDYAKKAYRASNRRDYLAQMTVWLQRQEAMTRKCAYLAWITDQTGKIESDSEGMADDGSDAEEGVEEAKNDTNLELKTLRQLENSNVARAYHTPLTPTHRQVTLAELANRYGAHDFLDALKAFLVQNRVTSVQPNTLDCFDLFKSFYFLLPSKGHVANSKRISCIRASAGTTSNRHAKARPSRFDTALVLEDPKQPYHREGLLGLRAVQVRVVFTLPQHLGVFPHPLLYVHLFRPFRTIDSLTGMYIISPSTRNQQPHSAIISANSLVSGCHLLPRFGSGPVNPSWITHSAIDQSDSFFLNHYIDFSLFDIMQ